MNNLLFLTNELINPDLQREMKLPLTFIQFGIAEGKMYKHFGNRSTFICKDSNKRWGNNVVYGGIFLCNDFDFYSRILDAYHLCSMSTMLRNHNQDLHHRVEIDVTPIYFKTLDELARIKYKEGKGILALTYKGNTKHPKIIKRLINERSFRVIDGIDEQNYKKLFWEVTG